MHVHILIIMFVVAAFIFLADVLTLMKYWCRLLGSRIINTDIPTLLIIQCYI